MSNSKSPSSAFTCSITSSAVAVKVGVSVVEPVRIEPEKTLDDRSPSAGTDQIVRSPVPGEETEGLDQNRLSRSGRTAQDVEPPGEGNPLLAHENEICELEFDEHGQDQMMMR